MKLVSAMYRSFIVLLVCICLISCTSSVSQHRKDNDSSNPFHCEVCFTPGENCLQLILENLAKAESSVHVMAYALTSQSITDALITAKKRGVSVVIVADKSQLHAKYSKLNQLFKAGIVIYIDHKPRIQHNKIMIIDKAVVIGGSYNWSAAAEKKNAENLTISHSSDLAARYEANFEKRKEASRLFDEGSPKNKSKPLRNKSKAYS